MNTRVQVLLWSAQRLSGALLAVFVCVHLITLIVAVQGGLSAAEITSRLAGSVGWLVFYLSFVVAAAVHAPIGMRNVLSEWTPLGARTRAAVCLTFTAALLWLGARAAFAMYGG